MGEVIVQGRGGQDAHTAGNLLAAAFFAQGLQVQCFASYGGARRGTPVSSYLRAAERPIRVRCDIERPDAILCFDASLLEGRLLAAPDALPRAGLPLRDMDLIDMHEAFAAQVLSNIKGLASAEWAARAGFSAATGDVDESRLNVLGGSLSIGHPFGATGGRIVTTVSNELARRGGQFALLTVCAAGGMGHAMVIERT